MFTQKSIFKFLKIMAPKKGGGESIRKAQAASVAAKKRAKELAVPKQPAVSPVVPQAIVSSLGQQINAQALHSRH